MSAPPRLPDIEAGQPQSRALQRAIPAEPEMDILDGPAVAQHLACDGQFDRARIVGLGFNGVHSSTSFDKGLSDRQNDLCRGWEGAGEPTSRGPHLAATDRGDLLGELVLAPNRCGDALKSAVGCRGDIFVTAVTRMSPLLTRRSCGIPESIEHGTRTPDKAHAASEEREGR